MFNLSCEARDCWVLPKIIENSVACKHTVCFNDLRKSITLLELGKCADVHVDSIGIEERVW